MAQYGRNFYGASYYGTSGVFAGQFLTDKTALRAPLTDVAPSDGKLYFDVYAKLANVRYDYTNNINSTDIRKSKMFIFQGAWNEVGGKINTTDSDMLLQAMLTCSDIQFNFVARADGAIVDITVTKYTNGTADASNTYTVNTANTATYGLNLAFGEYAIEIKMNTSSPVGNVFEFHSIDAITTDVTLEYRSTDQNISADTWNPWVLSSGTRTYDSISGIYKFSFETLNIEGANGYQLKLMLASSDNTTSPEITKLDIHTVETAEYSKDGLWKMVIDFGADVQDITSVDFEVVKPNDTQVELRSRTTSDTDVETEMIDENISWSWWSAPYSKAEHRALLDIKANANLKTGYVITPLISPDRLTNWISFLPSVFMTTVDPISGTINKNNSMTIDFVDSNLNVIVVNKVKQSFKMTDGKAIERGIKSITIPTRIKITFDRELGFPTPAIDDIYIKAQADYIQTIKFGAGNIEAYGSAVFGENTGIDAVYMDGVERTQLASTDNFDLVIPEKDTLAGKVSIGRPECKIDNVNMPGYPSDLLKLYWSSEMNKESKSSNIILTDDMPSDHIVVEVSADGNRIKKHIQYGSGITIKVETLENNNYDKHIIPNIFSPSLAADKKYAYYLSNGFSDETVNNNVDLRWNAENAVFPENRRNIILYQGGQINVSITEGTLGGLVEWKSNENIFEAKVNVNSPGVPKDTVIKLDSSIDLPDIPGDVIVDVNPFKVEVLDGSIVSEGQIVYEGDKYDGNYKPRINLSIDTTNNHYKITQEEKAKIIKSDSSKDYLPKQRTIQVLGIYQSPSQFSPTYVQDIHFTLLEGNKIDWSLAIDDPGLNEPTEGEELYVSYVYEELSEITITASCNYNRNDYDVMNVYRTTPRHYAGRCTYGVDYVSDEYNIEDLWLDMPATVDKTTLKLRAVIQDNDYVIAYVKDNRVVVTLGDMNPRENWNPRIRDGFYYIGKDQYYLFTNPYKVSLGDTTVPMATNITYESGVNDQGLLIQESTTNLFDNSRLDIIDDAEEIFVDRFER